MSDYDKVWIVPQYSDIERDEIDLTANLFGRILKVPVLSSPMDTVTGLDMMQAIRDNGGYGIHHRYCDYETLKNASFLGGIAVSPSMKLSDLEKILKLSNSKIAVLDVAHGFTRRNLEFCRELLLMGWNVISGNICTAKAAYAYYNIGVTYLRVGIGSGSVCTTREVTGVGIPQYIAIPEIKEVFGDDVHIIADGGLRTTGDIAKAFALGAEFVMLGGMLASTYEAEGKGEYSGMASYNAQVRRGRSEFFVEGKTEQVEINHSVKDVMSEIKSALETSCYYTGSRNLKEMYGDYKIL